MKFVTTVVFEDDEIETFRRAFNPLGRLEDYPDLIANLSATDRLQGAFVADYDQAKRIANTLTPQGDRTDRLSSEYLYKAQSVLQALQIALMRDRKLDYAPASEKMVAVIVEARDQQIANVEPALALLDRALCAWGGASNE
jgi:hypothetical protein